MSGEAKLSPPVRKWKRVKVDVRVRLRRWEERDDAATVVRSYELSEGGMSIYASETLEVGCWVNIEFTLPPSAEKLSLRAVVRNRRGFRCGLEFVEVPPQQAEEIRRYLAIVEGTLVV